MKAAMQPLITKLRELSPALDLMVAPFSAENPTLVPPAKYLLETFPNITCLDGSGSDGASYPVNSGVMDVDIPRSIQDFTQMYPGDRFVAGFYADAIHNAQFMHKLATLNVRGAFFYFDRSNVASFGTDAWFTGATGFGASPVADERDIVVPPVAMLASAGDAGVRTLSSVSDISRRSMTATVVAPALPGGLALATMRDVPATFDLIGEPVAVAADRPDGAAPGGGGAAATERTGQPTGPSSSRHAFQTASLVRGETTEEWLDLLSWKAQL